MRVRVYVRTHERAKKAGANEEMKEMRREGIPTYTHTRWVMGARNVGEEEREEGRDGGGVEGRKGKMEGGGINRYIQTQSSGKFSTILASVSSPICELISTSASRCVAENAALLYFLKVSV